MIALEDLKVGRIYRVHDRNLFVACYAGEGALVGIRSKFGCLFLEQADLYDQGGTVTEVVDDLGIDFAGEIHVDNDDLETLLVPMHESVMAELYKLQGQPYKRRDGG